MIRPDMSDRLVHLTKGVNDQGACQTLVSILEERVLLGGTGFIRGDHRCVCFCETPLSHLAAVLANRPESGFRYRAFGLMFKKEFIYNQTGRPVIYGHYDEYEALPDPFKYRHVRYEPTALPHPIDYTWEREWRLHIDTLHFLPEDVTVILPNRYFVQIASQNLAPGNNGEMQWHFLALEDIGVKISLEPNLGNPAVPNNVIDDL